MKGQLKISLVIPTYNRADVLDMTLARLGKQTVESDVFEVIVVDDGSSDHTKDVVNKHIDSKRYDIRYFWHENKGPGYSQNYGIKQSSSDIVLLIADDILANEDLIEEHIKSNMQYSDSNIAILGKAIQSVDLPKTVFHRYWDPFRYDKIEGLKELPSIYFFGCNISFKKNYLLDNGLFLERQGAAHEDIELGYRLSKKGLRIIYNEKALGYHHHPENLEKACTRAYERGINFNLLSDNIPKSYIFKLYSILSFEAGISTYMRLLPREILRGAIFNKLSIKILWLPILEMAERSRVAAFFANSYTYRGAINYHLRKGYWESQKGRK